ncbi:MAG: rhomboid family intramembrane serine protease, partial [Planctomycetaceae bacterium]|nr:rhomboid family intramembrane serine protease [Planctomycetaceae bacterium]
GAPPGALVPARLVADPVANLPTLLTHLFLHASGAHVGGNMLFLWIFGDNVEDRLGHLGYVVFYFVCGLAADASHILSNPTSEVPTLGASGAISGVMGAYTLFYPRAAVKTFVWLGIWYVDVIRTPAFLWIGFWFAQQILLNLFTRGGSGVAYLAHIGGFVAGALIAAAIRAVGSAWAHSGRPGPPRNPLDAGPQRRPFLAMPDEPSIEWMDENGDAYSVLRLDEDPAVMGTIGDVVHQKTGEPTGDVLRRLQTSRGLIARQVPREAAEAIQRELQGRGIPSAKILHNRANLPPVPLSVEGASWDARSIRFRSGDQILLIPWTAPFLTLGARSEGQAFIDVFVSRRSAFRVLDSRSILLTEIDPSGRNEVSAGFGGFARAVRQYASSASVNEGIAVAADGQAWGRLDFPRDSDYHDYVFWLYNLILARSPHA